MNKRQAIREAQQAANAVIEQRERQAKGWDTGLYRSDDTMRLWTIEQGVKMEVEYAFALSRQFAQEA